ncbi:hypothetical protein GFC01_14340 [Desulfofundulus thermobenzoicus]|uniref:Transposase IS204/IS1001/IS1096/IS1165 DDE domain-containing protein n=1 Tax=Desulfofundulus thermobenzoicus TaxID=29376 RepID=A0A6N7ITG1_9FIRM|nr:hypothetical protein [Desulfofundulus thermobenzoicus]
MRAYGLKLSFHKFFDQPDRISGERHLKRWYFRAIQASTNESGRVYGRYSKLVPFQSFKRILEGINSPIQAAKARARGYRNSRTHITIAYIISSRLDYGLPRLCLC